MSATWSWRAAAAVLVLVLVACGRSVVDDEDLGPAALPGGFSRVEVARGLQTPTSMAFAPDGRLFLTEKAGRIRVIKNGRLLDTPYKTLAVNTAGERGLLGIAFDPNFPASPYVYVYYTSGPGSKNYSGTPLNRVSRLRGTGDVAGSEERILLEITPQDPAKPYHNGGDIQFGPDGKLYVAVGDGTQASLAASTGNLRGKILRINRDGSIPADNPFVGIAGARGEVWAIGLRNPWRIVFHPVTGALIAANVGTYHWEELEHITKGRHYGWPRYEGPCLRSDPHCTPDPSTYPTRFEYPIYYYAHPALSTAHTGDGNASIIGGDFVHGGNYPGAYQGKYFVGDWVQGWVDVLTFDAAHTVVGKQRFDTIRRPTDFLRGPDGTIYVAAGTQGRIVRYVYRP